MSSEATPPASMGGVETEESAWESMAGGLAPRGERTVTLGRRLGVFFIAWRAAMEREGQRGRQREKMNPVFESTLFKGIRKELQHRNHEQGIMWEYCRSNLTHIRETIHCLNKSEKIFQAEARAKYSSSCRFVSYRLGKPPLEYSKGVKLSHITSSLLVLWFCLRRQLFKVHKCFTSNAVNHYDCEQCVWNFTSVFLCS